MAETQSSGKTEKTMKRRRKSVTRWGSLQGPRRLKFESLIPALWNLEFPVTLGTRPPYKQLGDVVKLKIRLNQRPRYVR